MDKENINEYERQRLENIRKNQEKLKELNLLSASLFFKDLTDKDKPKKKRTYKKRFSSIKPAFKRITRNQAKQLHIDVEDNEEVEKVGKENEETEEVDSETEDKLMSAEEYFSEETIKEAIIVDGHFKAWINPVLIDKYHFEKSAKEAWENNGGGKYSRKNPLGEYKEAIKTVKPRHWSSAKFVASKLFQKNPNAYFYRHLEPGLTQNLGDWDENEKELFMEIAKKYGCGDKWGIFSSYIPKRVGYQCANYYRQVIIPEGLIIDPNYKFTKWGKAIYCGGLNNNKKKKDKDPLINTEKSNSNDKNFSNVKEDKNEKMVNSNKDSLINNKKVNNNKNNNNTNNTNEEIEEITTYDKKKVNNDKKTTPNKRKNNINNANEEIEEITTYDKKKVNNDKKTTPNKRKNNINKANEKNDNKKKVNNGKKATPNKRKNNIKNANGKIDDKMTTNKESSNINNNEKIEREIIEIFDDSETESSYPSHKNNNKKNKQYPLKHMILRSESSTGYSLRKRRKITYIV